MSRFRFDILKPASRLAVQSAAFISNTVHVVRVRLLRARLRGQLAPRLGPRTGVGNDLEHLDKLHKLDAVQGLHPRAQHRVDTRQKARFHVLQNCKKD